VGHHLVGRARALVEQGLERAEFYRQEPAHRALLRGRLMRPYRVRQFAAFGANSLVHRPAWLYGTHKIAIGDNVMILNGAWLSAERDTWEDPGPAIVIGDHSGFRAWTTISASCRIEIGSHVVFGAGCSIVDSTHTWRNDRPSVMENPLDARPIRIGDESWLGDKVTVLRGAEIGRRCAIGAHSVVRDSIPAGSVAVGAPARVVGRTADL
jgi:acetyltransferase-like isoleucine patch superfamily enzyme